jgi:hypothetical protein
MIGEWLAAQNLIMTPWAVVSATSIHPLLMRSSLIARSSQTMDALE